MPGKRHIVLVSIVSLIVWSVVVQPASLYWASDVNSDGVCNVLDVQVIVSQALTTPSTGAGCDVNHDGCVDVRDLQRAVADLSKPTQTPSTATPDARPEACLTHKAGARPASLACQIVSAVRADEGAVTPRPSIGSHVEASGVQHGVRLFLFNLTSHAPPFLV